MKQLNLSNIGHEVALSAIAFNIGKWTAAKALGEINAERKAALPSGSDDSVDEIKAAVSIDRFCDFANSVNRSDQDTEFEELAPDRTVGFVEYCVLFAAVNDELTKLADGKNWPRPQSVPALLDWMVKSHPNTVKDSQLAELRALVEAHTGKPCNLTDDELRATGQESNQAQADQLASMFAANRDAIEDRINQGTYNYNRFSETSFETLFGNLPAKIRYVLLGSVDFKIEDKIDELFTGFVGKGANRKASKGANRPALVRASEISVLRADQALVKEARHHLELQAA